MILNVISRQDIILHAQTVEAARRTLCGSQIYLAAGTWDAEAQHQPLIADGTLGPHRRDHTLQRGRDSADMPSELERGDVIESHDAEGIYRCGSPCAAALDVLLHVRVRDAYPSSQLPTADE